MARIVAVNGSYRPDGVTDGLVGAMLGVLKRQGVEAEQILLREKHIGNCFNCRLCMQNEGAAPGHCVQHDDMAALVAMIEAADGFILAAPTNMGSVTALFKTFMERLAVYGYWPWGAHAPLERKAAARVKKAVLVSSSAAPGFMARFVYASMGQLKMTARLIGAKPVGRMSFGPTAQQAPVSLPSPAVATAERLALRLI